MSPASMKSIRQVCPGSSNGSRFSKCHMHKAVAANNRTAAITDFLVMGGNVRVKPSSGVAAG